jgi:hypothetical protein
MLKSLDTLENGFQEIARESKEECGEDLEKIRKLIFDLIPYFYKACSKAFSPKKKEKAFKYIESLVATCFWESFRTSGHILFLSMNGLYRHAFDTIRHLLESVVQALYVDIRHPTVPLRVKIEILKEIEDKREYHAIRLIDELEIDHKDKLKREYKELSRIIHPSHKQIVATLSDLWEDKGVPATLDCREISKIFNSMIRMYDIFFLLFMTYFPEVKKELAANPNFIKAVKAYKLLLLANVLGIRI